MYSRSKSPMDTVEETLQGLFIGISVATVLVQTCRHEKAIDIFNECLLLLKQHASKLGKDIVIEQLFLIYDRLSEAYKRVGDYTNAFECLQNSLELFEDTHQSFDELRKDKDKENYEKAATETDFVSRLTHELLCGGAGGEGDDVSARKKKLEKVPAVATLIGDKEREGAVLRLLGDHANSLSETQKALGYYKRALAIWEKTGDRKRQGIVSNLLGDLCNSAGDFIQAKQYYENALAVAKECGDRKWQEILCGNIATMYRSLNDFVIAKKFVQEALQISIENGDRDRESTHYHNLAIYCWSLREYEKADQYFNKSLALSKRLGDRNGEAVTLSGLANLYHSMNEYKREEETLKKALKIRFDICDISGEGFDRSKLASVCHILGKYEEATTCYQRAIEIHRETGNKEEEGNAYNGLSDLYNSLGDYQKAIECSEKSLALSIETRNRRAEGIDYGNLSINYQCLGNYVKAKHLREKAVSIMKESSGSDLLYQEYSSLGDMGERSGEYVDARENFRKGLEIAREIRDQRTEAMMLCKLASLEINLEEWSRAKDYSEQALKIIKKIGAIEEECKALRTLGVIYFSLGDIVKGMECLEMSLAIGKRILNKREEGNAYSSLGYFHNSLGDHKKAIEFYNEALKIAKESDSKAAVMAIYNNLGTSYLLQNADKAQECFKEALRITEEIGDMKGQSAALGNLAALYISQENFEKAFLYCTKCISILEGMHKSVGDSERYKIAFANREDGAYRFMARLFCMLKDFHMALSVLELGRARRLAELMVKQYLPDDVPDFHRLGLFNFQSVVQKSYCTCLSFLHYPGYTLIWILKSNELRSRKVLTETIPACQDKTVENWIDTLASHCFRMFPDLVYEECEDRSLNVLYHAPDNENPAACRLIEEENDHDETQWQLPLQVLHRLLIAPVADRLTGSEVIIVPDRSLFKVPFAALMNEKGEFLSEQFKIRCTPSLTTLKLIQDSPADYHSATGVLIVGDPDVGTVIHQGRQISFPRLPFANQEAEMIGSLLHVHPLTGRNATKQTVLQEIHSVGLIHIAAHGDADRGNIALAPSSPEKNDFLLTMSDISKVQLRAKLVVLSCCHSGKGPIKAEGVVGIARAFLGAGARSVLASLWAVDDEATMHFMKQFYEHLVCGKSASESLHETMKWMREKPECCEVRKWAPFMLIGDDVSFNFRN